MYKIESFGIVPFLKGDDGAWLVLVILHAKGNHWGFPKGKLDSPETALEAASRELFEETGLKVKELLAEQPFVESYHFMRSHQRIFKSVSYYPALVQGSLRLQKEEVKFAKWFSLQEAEQQLTFREAKQVLKRCIPLLQLEQ